MLELHKNTCFLLLVHFVAVLELDDATTRIQLGSSYSVANAVRWALERDLSC